MLIHKVGDEFVPVEYKHQGEKEVCCICGRVINGYGNNPDPFKRRGRCCDKCNSAYVLPIRMVQLGLHRQGFSKEKIEEKLKDFRKHWHIHTFEELSDKERYELGKIWVRRIENDDIVNVSFNSVNHDSPKSVEQLTLEEVITCINGYLTSIGKTIHEWVEEIDKDLVWLRYHQILAPRSKLIPSIFPDEDSLEAHRHMAGVNSMKFLLERMDAERVAEAESAAVN